MSRRSLDELVEEIESSNRARRVTPEAGENAKELEDVFGSYEDALDYVQAYRDYFGESEGCQEYVDQWTDQYNSVDGITASLEE